MKKLNNRILIISLVCLVAIFILTKALRSPGRESNFDTDLFKIDTSKISEVRIKPQKDSLKELRLIKGLHTWTVERDQIKSKVPPYQINSLMETLRSLKPQRMVTRKKNKWQQYDVSDSTGTEVIVAYDKDEDEELHLKIGKESNGNTYARVSDQEEVYALSGYLNSQFNKPFNNWRDQSILRIDKDAIAKITFTYPADSGFVLEKKDKTWTIGNENADSAKVEDYLSKLRSLDHDRFADSFAPAKVADATVTLTTNTNSQMVVKGWKTSFAEWVVNSSRQSETYFLDQGPILAPKIFIGRQNLLSNR